MSEKTKSNFFSKMSKMIKDVSYVGAIEGREAIASGLFTAAEKIADVAQKIEPTEAQKIKSDSIQRELGKKAQTQVSPA